MPRTLQEIQGSEGESSTLRGLVAVLHAKLQLRSRYALLEYEAGQEGRPESSELFRALSRTESAQIERLLGALVNEVRALRIPTPPFRAGDGVERLTAMEGR